MVKSKLEHLVGTNVEELNEGIVKAVKDAEKQYLIKQSRKEEKLSKETKTLMKKRRNMKSKVVNFHKIKQLNMEISAAIRKDVRSYNTKQITEVIEKNRSLKVLRRRLKIGKKNICKLRDNEGNIKTDKIDIIKITETFYKNLYKTINKNDNFETPRIQNVGSEEIPEISLEEVSAALAEMKNGKAPGEDGVLVEALKARGEDIIRALRRLFNMCLSKNRNLNGFDFLYLSRNRN